MNDDNDRSYCGLDAEKEELERKITNTESQLTRLKDDLDSVNWKRKMKTAGKKTWI